MHLLHDLLTFVDFKSITWSKEQGTAALSGAHMARRIDYKVSVDSLGFASMISKSEHFTKI